MHCFGCWSLAGAIDTKVSLNAEETNKLNYTALCKVTVDRLAQRKKSWSSRLVTLAEIATDTTGVSRNANLPIDSSMLPSAK
jgi:hypothetical protein